jgi:hypothetical protein
MILGLAGAAIWSEDLKNFLPFYRDTLGLKIATDTPGFVVLGEPNNPSLALATHSEVRGRNRDPARHMVMLVTDDAEADFQRLGRVRAGYVPDATILQLRELTRFRFKLVDQVGDAKRKALTVLDRVFPEYERLFSDVFCASSRRLLREATTAEEFADFDLKELTELLRRSSRGHFGREKAQVIQMAARNSWAWPAWDLSPPWSCSVSWTRLSSWRSRSPRWREPSRS